jgi:hypothetical protein
LGLSPEEFGKMTLREFYAKARGFGWLRQQAGRDRAEIIAAIGNFSGHLKSRLRVDDICPLPPRSPANIFYKRLFGLK